MLYIEPDSSFLNFIDPEGLESTEDQDEMNESLSLLQEPDPSNNKIDVTEDLETTHSFDKLTEISDNMTAELLNLFGAQPSKTKSTEKKVSSNFSMNKAENVIGGDKLKRLRET